MREASSLLRLQQKKHYDDNPELAKARKKQVSDYKNYKTSKKKKEEELTKPEITNVVETENEVVVEATVVEPTKVEAINVVTTIENKEEPKEQDKSAEGKKRQEVQGPRSSLSAYGHYHMGICYDY